MNVAEDMKLLTLPNTKGDIIFNISTYTNYESHLNSYLLQGKRISYLCCKVRKKNGFFQIAYDIKKKVFTSTLVMYMVN